MEITGNLGGSRGAGPGQLPRTHAPTRMTETPSYAPTTDTYAPTQSPTATAAPTYTVPTPRPTFTTECKPPEDPLPAICDNWTVENGTNGCNAAGMELHNLVLCPGTNPQEIKRTILIDCSPTGANCTVCGGRVDEETALMRWVGCCNYAPACG